MSLKQIEKYLGPKTALMHRTKQSIEIRRGKQCDALKSFFKSMPGLFFIAEITQEICKSFI